MNMDRADRRAERIVAICFAITTIASLALAGVYIAGGQPQAEGALLGVALGALGAGFIVWAATVLPHEIPGDREPHTPPVLLAGEARLEDLRRDPGRDPGAVVGEQDLAPSGPTSHGHTDLRGLNRTEPVERVRGEYVQ